MKILRVALALLLLALATQAATQTCPAGCAACKCR